MSYKSETIANILPNINNLYFLPAMQREFVWTEDQICALFDSLMRRYPISSFLFWQVPVESRDDVDAYEFLHSVKESNNRAPLARVNGNRDITFVLDGQQRLTALLVGLQGTYLGRKAKGGKGARTYVPKKLFIDLLHDGRVPDVNGEITYRFEFYDYTPSLLNQNSYWYEVGRILNVEKDSELQNLLDRQKNAIRDIRKLSSSEVNIVEHNLTNLYNAIWKDDDISYHAETNPDHERILEIFVRANSGGTKLSKSDLLLSTLTLHWGSENAREVINEFVTVLNTKLTLKNRLNKDFIMKSCLVILGLPVAYRVSSFTKITCSRIRSEWNDIQHAIQRAVDAANAFGIDENTLTSVNALIPIAYYLHQHPKLTLRGDSTTEVINAKRVRVWLISALLNHVLGGSSDSMLHKLREVLQLYRKPNGDFPIVELNRAIAEAGRTSASSENALANVLRITYRNKDTCFLALSLLYDERNWGTINYSIDHLFPQEAFKKNVPDHLKDFRDDFANLALVISDENSRKKNVPLHEWLASQTPEYFKRHFIPTDRSLWHIDRFESFLIERRKLLNDKMHEVFFMDIDGQ